MDIRVKEKRYIYINDLKINSMSRNQTLNDRQREVLSTCLPSCQNIVYPSLGAAEELAEYLQKLKYMVNWNDQLPAQERDHLLSLIDGFIHLGLALGAYAKRFRHEGLAPFELKDLHRDFEFPELAVDRFEALVKEAGDVKWMLDAIDFYLYHPAQTDPRDPASEMTSQLTADQNFRKLQQRLSEHTIDGKGDEQRTSVGE